MDDNRLACHVRIGSGEGLHLRKAAALSEFAKHYSCELRITHGDRRADAKSVLDVLCLGAGQGDELLLEADGPGSLQALEGISGFMAR
jgi:phosphocarrier protein FPr